jgi:hypothetical protein
MLIKTLEIDGALMKSIFLLLMGISSILFAQSGTAIFDNGNEVVFSNIENTFTVEGSSSGNNGNISFPVCSGESWEYVRWDKLSSFEILKYQVGEYNGSICMVNVLVEIQSKTGVTVDCTYKAIKFFSFNIISQLTNEKTTVYYDMLPKGGGGKLQKIIFD